MTISASGVANLVRAMVVSDLGRASRNGTATRATQGSTARSGTSVGHRLGQALHEDLQVGWLEAVSAQQLTGATVAGCQVRQHGLHVGRRTLQLDRARAPVNEVGILPARLGKC